MERTLSSGLFFGNTQTTTPAALPQRVLANLLVWQKRIASRHQLSRLDTRLLADAGITESQRYAELNKPFWR